MQTEMNIISIFDHVKWNRETAWGAQDFVLLTGGKFYKHPIDTETRQTHDLWLTFETQVLVVTFFSKETHRRPISRYFEPWISMINDMFI
jgi:hypothetical protein